MQLSPCSRCSEGGDDVGGAKFWQGLSKYVPFWLGVLATGIMLATAMSLLNLSTPFGKLCAFVAALLNAYGIHGVASWNPPREPWTHEQKLAESMRRIARGDAPLVGFEYLLPQLGTVVAPPPPLPPLDSGPTTK